MLSIKNFNRKNITIFQLSSQKIVQIIKESGQYYFYNNRYFINYFNMYVQITYK